MQANLKPHPDFNSSAVDRIEVEVTRPSTAILELRYHLTGTLTELALPGLAPPSRGDELWRHTCFEVFIRADSQSYCELNFAPSSQWAAYRFDSYRTGMRNIDPESLHIHVARRSSFELAARVTLDLPMPSLRIGLSAVIEQRDGSRSYWALAHPPGKPDFHHRDGFALELSAEAYR